MIKISEALVRFKEVESVSDSKVEQISQRILERYRGEPTQDNKAAQGSQPKSS